MQRVHTSKWFLLLLVYLSVLGCSKESRGLYEKCEEDKAAALAASDEKTRIEKETADEKARIEREISERDALARTQMEIRHSHCLSDFSTMETRSFENGELAIALAAKLAKADEETLNLLIQVKDDLIKSGASAVSLTRLDAEIEAKKSETFKKSELFKRDKDPQFSDGHIRFESGGEAPLSDGHIKKVLYAYTSLFKKCRGDQVGDLKLKFTIGADGSVSGTSASGGLAETPVADCAVAQMNKVRFGKSSSAKMFLHPLP
jgi:hypothetical protein